MNEEENKAMFYLKDLENDKEHLVIEQRQAIATILNLIEKQQSIIDSLNFRIVRQEDCIKELRKRGNKV